MDRWLGTPPLFMLVGLVLGFVASLFYVYRAIKNGRHVSRHWRLALCTLRGCSVAVLISAVLYFIYGGGHAWSFFYGAGAAVLSFVSTALTISLFSGRSMAAGVTDRGWIFRSEAGLRRGGTRHPGVPWPVAWLPMLIGFAGVYVAENVAATVRVARTRSQLDAEPKRRDRLAREQDGG